MWHLVWTELFLHSQAVTAGSGAAAATMLALARPSPSSLSMPWRLGRTHGRLWISTTTRLGARYSGCSYFPPSTWQGKISLRHNTALPRFEPHGISTSWWLGWNFGNLSWSSNWLHSIKHLLNNFSLLRSTLSVPPKHPIHLAISEVPLVPNNNSVFGVPEGPIYQRWMPLMTIPQLKNLRITGASLIRDPGEPDIAQHSVLCCFLK